VQDICKRVDLSSLHVGDEDHQPNVGGQALPDLNAPSADDDCQADGEVTFVVPGEQDYFDLSSQAHAQYEEMQESMITNLCYSSMLFIIMYKSFDLLRLIYSSAGCSYGILRHRLTELDCLVPLPITILPHQASISEQAECLDVG